MKADIPLHALARAIWSEAPADEAPAITRHPAFAVYRNTVLKGCVDALQANYPAVARLVGDDWFHSAATLYARAHPPADGRLVLYGADFADFLARMEATHQLPYLAPVARLDRMWILSHVAADAAPALPQHITSLPAEALATLKLAPHPAAQWAWFDGIPARTLWCSNRSDAHPEADPQPPGDLVWRGEGALLTRPALQVQWAPASLGSISFLDACAQGALLLDAAQAASEAEPGLDLSRLMAQLLGAGALQAPG